MKLHIPANAFVCIRKYKIIKSTIKKSLSHPHYQNPPPGLKRILKNKK